MGFLKRTTSEKANMWCNFSYSKNNRISKLHEQKIDFRAMNNLKDRLYNSDQTESNGYLPLSEFKSIKSLVMKNKLDFIDSLLLQQILVPQ